MRRIVERTDDHGLVWVSALKHDHHLHSDARNELHAPTSARPRVHRADPARAVVVVLTVPIPVKLNLDLAQSVDVDLAAKRPYDDSG